MGDLPVAGFSDRALEPATVPSPLNFRKYSIKIYADRNELSVLPGVEQCLLTEVSRDCCLRVTCLERHHSLDCALAGTQVIVC